MEDVREVDACAEAEGRLLLATAFETATAGDGLAQVLRVPGPAVEVVDGDPGDLRACQGQRHEVRAPDGADLDRRVLVRAALAGLPRQQRAVLVLRYLEDLPEAEVASLLGCSVGSVKTHAHRGLRALRGSLGDLDEFAVNEPLVLTVRRGDGLDGKAAFSGARPAVGPADSSGTGGNDGRRSGS